MCMSDSWVTAFSAKPVYREMRGFAGREQQLQSGALGTANQQPASRVAVGPIHG